MIAFRRGVAGLALGAMAALWWLAFDGLGEPSVIGPGVQREGVVVARAPFARQMRTFEQDGVAVTTTRSNRTWLAGWAVLLGGEFLLGGAAVWGLDLRGRAQSTF